MIKPNREAEQSVIGAIMLKPYEIMPECIELLDEEDFLTPECRTIFHYCSGYFVDGKPIDFVILGEQLGKEYLVFMAQCADMVPSTRNWREYARIVKNTGMRQRACEKATELVSKLSVIGDGLGECQELAADISRELTDDKRTNTYSSEDGFVEFYSSLQRDVEYIRTGFSHLDRYTYIERGDYVVIGARPSVGKTAITLQMMLHMSKSLRVAYFSLETNALKLFSRMASTITGIPLSKIKTRENLGFMELAAAKADFAKRDFFVVNAAGMGVAEIRAKAIQLGAKVVIVDYIGLMKSPGKTPYERTTNASIALHIMAQTCNIAVFAVSQLSREARGKPDITHLRESGQIEQDADVILMLHAPEGKDNPLREIGVVKNKEGRIGQVMATFDGRFQQFREMEEYRNEY